MLNFIYILVAVFAVLLVNAGWQWSRWQWAQAACRTLGHLWVDDGTGLICSRCETRPSRRRRF